jgi:transposase
MRYLGLDVHKRVVQAYACDASGQPLHDSCGRFDLTMESLHTFARAHLDDDCKVALEATTNTWAVVDVLAQYCPHIVVSNPMRTRAIAAAKVKTDKVDAQTLAHLLRLDYLPTVWTPDPETRAQRSIASRRSALVRQSISLKNRIHSVLHQRLIQPPCDPFSQNGRTWLAGVDLPFVARGEIDTLLRLLDALHTEQRALAADIDRIGFQRDDVKLLMTLPGVDVTIAHALVAAIGDIRRFPSADRLAAYFGLVPSTRQSAETTYHGRITKQGNTNARWLLIQAAQAAAKHPGPLGHQFNKLARRKPHAVALVAIAHKLAILVWHLLTHRTPYRYAIPSTVETKLARLRVSQQGKRKSGPAKASVKTEARPEPLHGDASPIADGGRTTHAATPPSARPPKTRLRKSLDRVLADEHLPMPRDTPTAESRWLDVHGLTDFAHHVRSDHYVERSSNNAKSKAGQQAGDPAAPARRPANSLS